MNNTFEDVISLFLSLITDVKYIDYTEEELYLELGTKVKLVITRAKAIKNLYYDVNKENLSRKISDEECTILAYGLLYQWLQPKVNNFELIETQMSSKDFTIFSNANRLSELRSLRDDAESMFEYALNQYDLSQFNLGDE